MVSIRKFQIIVLVSNLIEYWSNYSIQLEISNIRTALEISSTSDTMEWTSSAPPAGHSRQGEHCKIT